MGSDFFDIGNPGSKVVGSDSRFDDTYLTFDPDVFAVGLDIFADTIMSVSVLSASPR